MFKILDGNIIRISDGATIPQVQGNRDYRKYQIWLALGNTPVVETTPRPQDQGEVRRQQLRSALAAISTTNVTNAPTRQVLDNLKTVLNTIIDNTQFIG